METSVSNKNFKMPTTPGTDAWKAMKRYIRVFLMVVATHAAVLAKFSHKISCFSATVEDIAFV